MGGNPKARGTSNANERGSALDRLRRREWLVRSYASDMSVWPRQPTCRCYRCGELLTVLTVTVDRIIPASQGGTYRRNNIRPACGPCNIARCMEARP